MGLDPVRLAALRFEFGRLLPGAFGLAQRLARWTGPPRSKQLGSTSGLLQWATQTRCRRSTDVACLSGLNSSADPDSKVDADRLESSYQLRQGETALGILDPYKTNYCSNMEKISVISLLVVLFLRYHALLAVTRKKSCDHYRILRAAAERTIDGLWQTVTDALGCFKPQGCRNASATTEYYAM